SSPSGPRSARRSRGRKWPRRGRSAQPSRRAVSELDLRGLTDEQIMELAESIPPHVLEALTSTLGVDADGLPQTPLEQALELDHLYAPRPHLKYLSDRLAKAVRDVEAGQNRLLTVSMPPRMGKSILSSLYTPIWLQRTRPSWKIGMLSHDDTLVNSWASQARKIIEENPHLGIRMVRDHGASSRWTLAEGGGLVARAVGSSVTGLGFKVLILDDIVKDFVTAHSKRMRDLLWDKWRADIFTRLEPPYLVVAVGTRRHEDDFIGRLLSPDYEGDPDQWETITFPAIAVENDVLGREPGQPLYSPLKEETEEEALARWQETKDSVGSYTWAALYQQTPAPAKGAIFDDEWWRYWTFDPNLAKDERVVLLDPKELARGWWLDSWDTSFKGNDSSDFVVGQRWVRFGPYRALMAQRRGRWSFTQALEEMEEWAKTDDEFASPFGQHVHLRLVEESANGPAILDVMKQKVSGMKSVKPRDSKEARARAITPEIESGHVLLPHPREAGWVPDLLSELRNFPHDINDDQVDALTQALLEFRDVGRGGLTVPSRGTAPIARRNIAQVARTDFRRGGATPNLGRRRA